MIQFHRYGLMLLIFLIVAVVFLISGCGTNTADVNALEEEIEDLRGLQDTVERLESRIAYLEEKTQPITAGDDTLHIDASLDISGELLQLSQSDAHPTVQLISTQAGGALQVWSADGQQLLLIMGDPESVGGSMLFFRPDGRASLGFGTPEGSPSLMIFDTDGTSYRAYRAE